MLCFLCTFLSFSWRILPQTEFSHSPHSILSVTRGHSQLTTREIIAMCKAAKTVKTVFYKKSNNFYLDYHDASDQWPWTLSEDELTRVGSDRFINKTSAGRI